MCLGYKFAQLTRIVFKVAQLTRLVLRKVKIEVKVQSEGTATNDIQLLRTAVKVVYLMTQWQDI